jgi:hypothetical protein
MNHLFYKSLVNNAFSNNFMTRVCREISRRNLFPARALAQAGHQDFAPLDRRRL